MTDVPRVLFIFWDGVGIGPADPSVNPFLQARLPTLRSLLPQGIPVLGKAQPSASDDHRLPGAEPEVEALALPLDALLGVEGLPQSGTGQTALFTGENAPALYGRHFGPWVPVSLRPLLMQRNLLTRAQAQGIRCAFANAYPRRFMRLACTKRPAGPPLAAQGAGLFTRTESDLARGEAVSSEILNTAWRTRLGLAEVPEVTAAEAGRTLARIASQAELTLFAHYSTDTAGHERAMDGAVEALERFDAFLEGVISSLSPRTLLVLASDHGNIEDVNKGHTRNPTFCILRGPGAKELGARLSSITDIPPLILGQMTSGRQS